MKIPVLLGVAATIFLVSGCVARYSGPESVIFVAVHDVDQPERIKCSDVAQITLTSASDSANHYHLLEDFIGKRTLGISKGNVLSDVYIFPEDKSDSTAHGKNYSLTDPLAQIVPVLKAAQTIPAGTIVCSDNVTLIDVPVSTVPNDVVTELSQPLIAMKPMAKGDILTIAKLSGVTIVDNRCQWFATHDMKAGQTLGWKDFRAHAKNDDVDYQVHKAQHRDEDSGAPRPLFDFSEFNQHRLARSMKKSEPLVAGAIGPQLVPVVAAARALSVGTLLKESDLKMVFVEENQRGDKAEEFLTNLVGDKVKRAIKLDQAFDCDKDVESTDR